MRPSWAARLMRLGLLLLGPLLLVRSAVAQPSPSPRQIPPTVTLPSELVTEIAVYLQDRPYREVAGLLGALQQAIADQTRPAEPAPPAPGSPPTPPQRDPASR